MVISMATVKLTITLSREQFNEVKAIVGQGRSASVSAFVQHAVKIALHDAAGWKEMLDAALEETGGPVTRQERAWARALLAGKAPRPPRRPRRRAA